MQDIRLDYISHIEQKAIDLMTEIRKKFINLDNHIQYMENWYPCISDGSNPIATRSIELARTHLETALQFTIKSLCLAGEIKDHSKGVS